MAQNTTIAVPAGVWTLLTDANVTALTFQNIGLEVYVTGTVGAVAPTTLAGAIRYEAGQGERNVALVDLFPGIAATRVYAYSSVGSSLMVSHA